MDEYKIVIGSSLSLVKQDYPYLSAFQGEKDFQFYKRCENYISLKNATLLSPYPFSLDYPLTRDGLEMRLYNVFFDKEEEGVYKELHYVHPTERIDFYIQQRNDDSLFQLCDGHNNKVISRCETEEEARIALFDVIAKERLRTLLKKGEETKMVRIVNDWDGQLLVNEVGETLLEKTEDEFSVLFYLRCREFTDRNRLEMESDTHFYLSYPSEINGLQLVRQSVFTNREAGEEGCEEIHYVSPDLDVFYYLEKERGDMYNYTKLVRTGDKYANTGYLFFIHEEDARAHLLKATYDDRLRRLV